MTNIDFLQISAQSLQVQKRNKSMSKAQRMMGDSEKKRTNISNVSTEFHPESSSGSSVNSGLSTPLETESWDSDAQNGKGVCVGSHR